MQRRQFILSLPAMSLSADRKSITGNDESKYILHDILLNDRLKIYNKCRILLNDSQSFLFTDSILENFLGIAMEMYVPMNLLHFAMVMLICWSLGHLAEGDRFANLLGIQFPYKVINYK